MLPDKIKELLKPKLMIPKIIWFALTVSILIYVGIAFVISQQAKPTPIEPTFRMILSGLSVFIGLISLFIFKRSRSDEWLKEKLKRDVNAKELATSTNQNGGTSIDQERLEKLEQLSPQELKWVALPTAAFVPMILNLVLNETIVIFGLVMSFMSHQFQVIIPFAVAGLLLNVIMFPNLEKLVERASRMNRI